MAHIPDGILSLPVLAGGGVLAAGGLALGLARLDEATIPRAAALAAAFFVLSLVQFPLGPTSVHLLLGGLMGLTLGWGAFPAVLVGLLLQLTLFGFGGLTTLGINTLNIALPGVVLAALARPLIAGVGPGRVALVAGLAGAGAVAVTGGGVALALTLSHSAYVPAARIALLTYLPLMAVEGIATGLIAGFLARVRPDLIGAAPPAVPA
jgi:cobalt/nickel transport system permease protein